MYCAGLLLGQRIEVISRDHALRQLLEFRAREHAAQLGLADQHDLQQLALAGLQVGQQAQLLQHVGRQVLRLVDDQHVVLADRVGAQQVLVEPVDVILERGRVPAAVSAGNLMPNSWHTVISSSSAESFGLKM